MAVACYEEEFTYIKCVDSDFDNTTIGKIYKCIEVLEETYTYIDNDDDYNEYNKGNFEQSTKDDYDKQEEIIEEKKPLYTNSYGTEFFEGDRYYYVGKKTLMIHSDTGNSVNPKPNALTSEIMTEKECHQWIVDNWDELKK
jgi:hypothetical protein